MNILYLIVPIAILMAISFVIAFFWATHNGQYDDMDTPAYKILTDEYKKDGKHARDE